MIKIILFDGDGVVIKLEKMSTVYKKHLKERYGILEQDLNPFFEHQFNKCLVGKADFLEELTKFLEGRDSPEKVKELMYFMFKNEEFVDRKLLDLIQDLRAKGIKCCLATNQEKHRLKKLLVEDLKLDKLFDQIFASCELGYKKPEQEFYQAVTKKLEPVNVDEILFFDNEEPNVEGANKFGIKSFIYNDFETFKWQLAENGID